MVVDAQPEPQSEPPPEVQPEPIRRATSVMLTPPPIAFADAARNARKRVLLDLCDVPPASVDAALDTLLAQLDPGTELAVCLLSRPPFSACAKRGIVFELLPDDTCLGSADTERNNDYRAAKRALVIRKWSPVRQLAPAERSPSPDGRL